MRYSEVLDRLQNLINYRPSQAELMQILNVKQSTMSNRVNRNSDISIDEISKINEHYGINLYTSTSQTNQENEFIITVPQNAKNIIVKITHGQSVRVEVI